MSLAESRRDEYANGDVDSCLIESPKGYQVLVDEFSAKSTSENNSTKPKSSIVTQYANASFIEAKQLTFRVDRVRRGWAPTILGCENLTFRKLSQFDPITRKTLAKY